MASVESIEFEQRERPLKVRLPGTSKDWSVLVRATSAFEDSDAVGFAIAAAKKAGAEPKRGDPVYDIHWWAHIVGTAYLDVDSSPGSRRPAFPGGAAQVLKKLSTESIAYLFQEQMRWQEEVSPSFKARSIEELVDIVEKVAMDGGDFFFAALSPSTQCHSARFMAALLVSSPDTTWRNGSPSGASTASSSSSPPKPSRRRGPGLAKTRPPSSSSSPDRKT